MKKEIHIKELAELFNVPPSTLRFWEKKGLLDFERITHSQYRTASMETIRNLCDITFYRKLSVPIAEIKELIQTDYLNIEQILLKNREQLMENLKQLNFSVESIDAKLTQISILKELEKNPFEFVTTALPAIRPFDIFERSDIHNLVRFERDLLVMIPAQKQSDYRYGVFVSDDYPKEKLIRNKDEQPKKYLKVLLKTHYEKIEHNNLNHYYEYLYSQGYRPGLALGKVLISSFNGEAHNFYETWIEALSDE